MKLRVAIFLICFACYVSCFSFSFGQTTEVTQVPEYAADFNAGTADEPSADPQHHAKGGQSGTAARTKPTPTAPGPTATPTISTTYVFPTSREMNRYWLKNTIGPKALIGATFTASWNQWIRDDPRQWTKDAKGWGQRYGSALLDNGINTSSLVLISRATGQDPRYRRCDCAGTWPRARQAIKLAFMSYNRNGNVVFSAPKMIAPFTGPLVTRNLIYPNNYGFSDAGRSGAYYFAGSVGWNLVREFIWKKAWF